MGYFKRIGDKRYRITYDVLPENGNRRRKRETLAGVSKREAEAMLALREAEVQKRRNAIARGEEMKDEVMLSTLFEGFFAQKRLQKEATTMRRYESLFKLYLKPRFGDKKAGMLRPHNLTDAYTDWLHKGRDGYTVSARTVRHAHELLRNILNWGVRRELLSRNVAALISDDDLPKVVKPKPKALTETELRRLLAEAKNPSVRAKKRGTLSSQPWFYPAIAFAAYTGARRGEVLALRCSDVNFDAKQVTIARSITEKLEFKRPKNDKARTITISETLAAILRSHRATQAEERLLMGSAYRDAGLVFAHADGLPVDPWNFGRAVLDCIIRSGVSRITLHGLRDTHASLLAKKGIPLEVISKRLGHSNIAIRAERYLDVYQERDVDAAGAFEKLVG